MGCTRDSGCRPRGTGSEREPGERGPEPSQRREPPPRFSATAAGQATLSDSVLSHRRSDASAVTNARAARARWETLSFSAAVASPKLLPSSVLMKRGS